jgi:hypothetical protein
MIEPLRGTFPEGKVTAKQSEELPEETYYYMKYKGMVLVIIFEKQDTYTSIDNQH